MSELKLFAGSASVDLAENIATCYGQPLGEIVMQQFSDGEFQPNYTESIRGCFVYIIQSTFAPADNLMELLLDIDAAKRASADYITAVIPYFGLARQDRKDKPRVSIGSKMVANILSAAGANRVMKLHIAGINHYDPLGRAALRKWLQELRDFHSNKPAFIAVGFDEHPFERIKGHRAVAVQG